MGSAVGPVGVTPSETDARRLGIVADCDLSHLATKAAPEYSYPSAEYMAAGIFNLKLLYAMFVVGRRQQYAIPAPLDALWQSHIVYADQYERFCFQAFGCWADRTPIDLTSGSNRRDQAQLYAATLQVVDQTFGSRDRTWWPDISAVSAGDHPARLRFLTVSLADLAG